MNISTYVYQTWRLLVHSLMPWSLLQAPGITSSLGDFSEFIHAMESYGCLKLKYDSFTGSKSVWKAWILMVSYGFYILQLVLLMVVVSLGGPPTMISLDFTPLSFHPLKRLPLSAFHAVTSISQGWLRCANQPASVSGFVGWWPKSDEQGSHVECSVARAADGLDVSDFRSLETLTRQYSIWFD